MPAPSTTTSPSDLVVSPPAAKACTSFATKKPFGRATIAAFPPGGPVERLHVEVFNLLPKNDFVIFVIQVPNAPFGMAWYGGDILTDDDGHGVIDIVGRFSTGTFMVAPGMAPAPVVFAGPFPDASLNPTTNPIQMYHIGIWFNDPNEAKAAGCPGNVTPFTSNHQAGIQQSRDEDRAILSSIHTAKYQVTPGPRRPGLFVSGPVLTKSSSLTPRRF